MLNKITKIKTIFIGTPDFSVPAFNALYSHKSINMLAVITQPDKKSGRKQKLSSPPIKIEARKYNIPIWQPEKIIDAANKIKALNPDLIIVIAYAQLIPKEILGLPKHGCVNVHGSLLPKYRGASCVQAPILKGDKETGITIMRMDAGLDTGPIIKQHKLSLGPSDTAGILSDKLSRLAARTIVPVIEQYIAGKLIPRAQDENQASYTKTLRKLDGKINWGDTAEYIERFIRAMSPWPGAFSYFNKLKIIKIIKTEATPIKINDYKIGEIFFYQDGMAVQCGQDALAIAKLQIAGKKIITGKDFVRGYKSLFGVILNKAPAYLQIRRRFNPHALDP